MVRQTHHSFLGTYASNEYAALLPIFKILVQIKNNNEDESYRNLVSQSDSLAQSHRIKIIKAHVLIKHFKHYCINLHKGRPHATFLELLDDIFCQELMLGLFSNGQLSSYYDLFKHKSVKIREFMDEDPPAAMVILNGVYGSPFISSVSGNSQVQF